MRDVTVIHGDCLEAMAGMAEASVDACVTDPPYGLEFMGKEWDGADGFRRSLNAADVGRDNVFGRASARGPEYRAGSLFQQWCETWARECLRVLKPGGHLLAFGGTRTYHRLACAIEDAGFEVRDAIMWHYGQGFPKSLDVSKAIDSAAGAERKVVGRNPNFRDAEANAEHHERWNSAVMSPNITAPATDAARQWQGWGTALKPATEIICLARKPLSEATVAANVLRWGTGALNVDATRVLIDDDERGIIDNRSGARPATTDGWGNVGRHEAGRRFKSAPLGRWPANVCHDGSDEVLALFPETASGTGAVKRATSAGWRPNAYGKESRPVGTPNIEYGDSGCAARFFFNSQDERGRRPGGFGNVGAEKGDPRPNGPMYEDGGSAARFFYCSKASKADRAGSKHPTVKPVVLKRWLCRMATPPGGIVLDPFAGSGTTGQAALMEGFKAILIEREAEYVADIHRRLPPEPKLEPAPPRKPRPAKPADYRQLDLFAMAAE